MVEGYGYRQDSSREEPSFILVIQYRGLCAFVPRKDGKRAWVYLVRVGPDEIREEWTGVRPHQAAVRFDLDKLDVKWPNVGNNSIVKVPREGRVIWPLDSVDLFIAPGGDICLGSDLNIIGWVGGSDGANLPIPEVGEPSDSFAYVSCLERACVGRGCPPGGGQILPDLLRRTVEPGLAQLIAARLPLGSGRLSVDNHGEDSSGRPVVWRYRPYSDDSSRFKTDHRQIVATGVELRLPIYRNFVRLEARSLTDRSEIVGQLDLRPVGVERRITVQIMNEEADEYFFKPQRPRFEFGKPREADQIIESYYKLAINPPHRNERPIPVADYVVGSRNPGGAESSPPCSPSRMLGVNEPSGEWDR